MQFTHAALSSFLNQEDDNNVVQVISCEDLGRDTAAIPEQTNPNTG